MLCRPGSTAVAHGRQHRKDEPLQEGGLSLANPVQYFCGHGGIRFVYRSGNRLARGGLGPSQLGLTSLTGLSTSQLISLVVGIAALVILIIRRRPSLKIRENTDSPANNFSRQRQFSD